MPRRVLPAGDDKEHWRDAAFAKETRVRLEEKRQQGLLLPNYKPRTLQGIAVVERYWRSYCEHASFDYIEHLCSEEPAVYMDFFDWLWRMGKETGRKRQLQSYDEYWRRLGQYFQLLQGRSMNGLVHEQLRRFLAHQFPAERQTSRKTQEKRQLSIEEYGLIQRYWWMYSDFFQTGNMHVQQSVVKFWSSIIGTRPGVMLPPSSPKRPTTDGPFKSDVPEYISTADLPPAVCWRDIELFFLRDPDGGRDVPCMIIEFRNLEGRPEGVDGTQFFMHCDSQLADCPVLHIVSLAFRDRVFPAELTPETFWRLRVPKRLSDLPIRWRKDMLDVPVLRRMRRTATGIEVDPQLPMTYDVSNAALEHTGEELGFRDPLTYCHFPRWPASEADRSCIDAERMTISDQPGNKVFRRCYQEMFVVGLQRVTLLRPLQAALCRSARRIRGRDPNAPTSLRNDQLQAIDRDPRIRELRQRRNQLRTELRWAHGTIKQARKAGSGLFEEHRQVCRNLQKTRKMLHRQEKIASREHYYNTMPAFELEKQINRLHQGLDADASDGVDEDEDDTKIPEYRFEERRRIVEAFYGPDAESLDGDATLQKRIQVTKDLVALCGRWEPSRRGRWCDEEVDDDPDDDSDGSDGSDESEQAGEFKTTEPVGCPTSICIVCLGASVSSGRQQPRPMKRIDSLRRHVIGQHLDKMGEDMPLRCVLAPCQGQEAFGDPRRYLAHARHHHRYDLRIGERQFARLSSSSTMTPPSPDSTVSFDDEPGAMGLRDVKSANHEALPAE